LHSRAHYCKVADMFTTLALLLIAFVAFATASSRNSMGLLRSPLLSYYSSVPSLTARGVASADADPAHAAKRAGSVQGISTGLNPATQTLRARLIGRLSRSFPQVPVPKLV
jgi:hypothetical protein